jgi:hypothetical protein
MVSVVLHMVCKRARCCQERASRAQDQQLNRESKDPQEAETLPVTLPRSKALDRDLAADKHRSIHFRSDLHFATLLESILPTARTGQQQQDSKGRTHSWTSPDLGHCTLNLLSRRRAEYKGTGQSPCLADTAIHLRALQACT